MVIGDKSTWTSSIVPEIFLCQYCRACTLYKHLLEYRSYYFSCVKKDLKIFCFRVIIAFVQIVVLWTLNGRKFWQFNGLKFSLLLQHVVIKKISSVIDLPHIVFSCDGHDQSFFLYSLVVFLFCSFSLSCYSFTISQVYTVGVFICLKCCGVHRSLGNLNNKIKYYLFI